jgi:hypothetical protein
MEIPINNRIIVKKKSVKTSITSSGGIDIETDFAFAEVIASDPSSLLTFHRGDIICVSKNKLYDVPYDNSMELFCYSNDVIHYRSNKERFVDKSM